MIKRKNKNSIIKFGLLGITTLLVVFIFTRSLTPSIQSAEESTNVLVGINSYFQSIGFNIELSDFIIRKAAHFTEFMCLGILLTLTLNRFFYNYTKYIFADLFLVTIIPLCDEGLQYFSVGRSPEVKDVFLDLGGAVTGIIIVTVIMVICKKIKDKR